MSIDDARLYRDRGLLQPPRRQRSRTDDFAFQAEHVERLQFIKRSLAYGLTVEDIAQLVDPYALTTCGDVSALADKRLEQMRQSGAADTPAAFALTKLREGCARVGSRKDCAMLATLGKNQGSA
jgi:DNA-binding transcriptional MerR regulator